MSAVTQFPVPHSARHDTAAAIRAHLAVRQISDSELARMIGATQSQISRRTNERVPFDVDELGKIASALDLSVVDLIQMPKSVPGGGTTLYGVGTGIKRALTARIAETSGGVPAVRPAVVASLDKYRQRARTA